MENPIKIALVGLGGYGNHYLEFIFKTDKFQDDIEFVAGIDPNPVGCKFLEDFAEAGIPIFPNLDAFYKEMTADLLIISTPIHLHEPMTCQALSQGSHVLCEKPLAATIQEAKSMLNAEKTSDNKQVAIGYQWSYSPATIKLKKDILNGRFGKSKTLKTITLWPRLASYYDRAPWAGRIQIGDRWVMDSPLANATAHYLHNMLYLLGEEESLSAVPKTVTAETYRAKQIENFDTAMVRCMTANDEEILFYTTHSCSSQIGPMISFEFEKATVLFAGGAGDNYIAHFNDGSVEEYGSPNGVAEAKVTLTAEAIRNQTKFRCGIEAAGAHLLIVNAIQKPKEEIINFPEGFIVKTQRGDDDSLIHVKGLEEVMLQCYAQGILPAEHGGIIWAVPAETLTLSPNKIEY